MKRSVSGDERVGVRSATPKGSTPLMRSLSLSGVGGAGYTPWVGAGGTGGGGGYTPWVGATGYPTGGGGGAGGAAAGGWGVGFSGFPPLAGEEYGPRNLARRPRDWRADYNPRGGLSILPGFVTKGRSDVQDYHDPQRRMLHPLLQYQANNPPISHDLRVNPFDTSRYDLFVNLARAHNQIDFAQLATQPAASMMRLYHPHLPWYIDVKPSHPNGVTVHDVLMYVYRQLMTPISGRHFWNEELGEEEREGVTKAFWERCGTSQGEVGRGVLQVDFLGRRVIFEGLARGRGGIWEIKTSKVDPR
ncbi:hypothetical protein FA15DRAFT_674764 [Coprinopsis marcescibilis]|uniref:DUF6699 domain-containing protein n=1 Tax=Coprinopsis marcescibilis TaxID=230819 RepID=A0A5C3KG48_COPMA|nr:hypothetical protein FA15DRAFT_674764 [Coprinopsis marcescibilis]